MAADIEQAESGHVANNYKSKILIFIYTLNYDDMNTI